MNRRLLAVYPRDWRERYGAEVLSLSEELVAAGETTRLRAGLGLIGGAVIERWRVLASPAVLVPMAAVMTFAGADALTDGYGAARLYYDSHRAAGVLLLVAGLGWLVMEGAEFRRGRRSRYWRARAARTGQPRFWLAVWASVTAETVLLNLAPLVIPAATIRLGAVAFTAGMVALAAGIGLRRWSFAALRGRYFSFTVAASPDQPVIAAGPYRALRHPGHAGMLLICVGFGLASANWAGLAAEALLPLAILVWRIRAEEKALFAALGDRYRCYARGRRRLVPLIW